MAEHEGWDDRPWERREGGRERETHGEGWRGREAWRGGERDPGRRDWRAYPGEEWDRSAGERRWTEWEGDRRGRDWRPERERPSSGRWGASDWRPEMDRPWVERGPTRRAQGDTRGMVEWEDRGPLAWLGDRLRGRPERRPRGPKGYTRSDERIHDEVCERIARSGVDADAVEVKVEKGEVTLAGTVARRDEKWWLEALADDVFGVDEVHNRLRVARGEVREHDEGGMPH
jgi:hypothetical protein